MEVKVPLTRTALSNLAMTEIEGPTLRAFPQLDTGRRKITRRTTRPYPSEANPGKMSASAPVRRSALSQRRRFLLRNPIAAAASAVTPAMPVPETSTISDTEP